MARINRVDPWGDLHAPAARGLFTGNRGCLVDDERRIVRHHRGRLWITCVTTLGDRTHPLDAPGTWTPLFFLDDAVALAAGHRPCGHCRRDDYRSYRSAITTGLGADRPLRAVALDARLTGERLRRGRGLRRAGDRITWPARVADLPAGVVIVDRRRRHPHLLSGRGLHLFDFAGWGPPEDPVDQLLDQVVDVLTPPTSVEALRHGFVPTLHPSVDPRPIGAVADARPNDGRPHTSPASTVQTV